MKFKNIILGLMSIGASAAVAMPPKPAQCPAVAAIHSVGITIPNILPNADQWLVVNGSPHQYGTHESWGLVVTLPREFEEGTTVEIAAQSLDSLAYEAGPKYVGELDAYICTYTTSVPIAQVFVLTPPNIV